MARRRKPRGGGDHGGGGGGGHGGSGGRWLVSYADFITLMFVVFVVLFAFAKVDLAKYSTLSKSLRSAMGKSGGPDLAPIPQGGATPGQVQPVTPPQSSGGAEDLPDWQSTLITPVTQALAPVEEKPAETKPVETKPAPSTTPTPKPATNTTTTAPKPPPDAMSELAKAMKNLPGARTGLLQVALEERGLRISLAGSVLFDPGQTTLKPTALEQLNAVAGQLKGVEYPVMVQGTADEQPTGPLSVWDLAALRAGAVVRYLVEQRGLPAEQFVTIGYGSGAADAGPDRLVHIVVLRKGTTP